MLICDLCSDPNPVWRYPCNTFTVMLGGDLYTSHGDWAACAYCAELINGGWDKTLLKYSWATGNVLLPIEYIKALHDGFYKNRKGPAVRI